MAPGRRKLPVAVAGTNAAILLSSSITMHWTDLSAKRGNTFGMRAGIVSTMALGATFLFIQINEYIHLGFTPKDSASASIFFGLTGLHGAHVLIGLILLSVAARADLHRATSARRPTRASRCRASTGTSST